MGGGQLKLGNNYTSVQELTLLCSTGGSAAVLPDSRGGGHTDRQTTLGGGGRSRQKHNTKKTVQKVTNYYAKTR